MVVSHHVDARNGTWVLCKSSQCSKQLSHLSLAIHLNCQRVMIRDSVLVTGIHRNMCDSDNDSDSTDVKVSVPDRALDLVMGSHSYSSSTLYSSLC